MSNDLEKIQIRIGISGGETRTVTHYDGKNKGALGEGHDISKKDHG
jgi:hypothetical protein